MGHTDDHIDSTVVLFYQKGVYFNTVDTRRAVTEETNANIESRKRGVA